MKVVFISNYFNHHQEPFSNKMAELCDYRFIAMTSMDDERLKLGWKRNTFPDYYLMYSKENSACQELIDTADVVIFGSANEKVLSKRKRENKLIVRYAERQLKNGMELWRYPYRFLKWHMHWPGNKPIYMLCASAYTSADFAKFGLFKNKTYKWGYFPETKHYNPDDLFAGKSRTEILWCGRFLGWKHTADAVDVAKRLRNAGYDFEMNIIGTGILESALKATVSESSLEDCVHFLGAMSPENVRKYMETSGIFLFTSDRKEGWGAVLNESMNSGCAVVASDAIGAVPYLMKNNETGLIYKSGDVNALFNGVKYLLDNPNEQRRLGEAAYQTIVTEWNAEIGAERFVSWAQCILDGDNCPNLYESGPCSRAEIIEDNWYDG